MLSLLVFAGEAVRDAFDQRKTFGYLYETAVARAKFDRFLARIRQILIGSSMSKNSNKSRFDRLMVSLPEISLIKSGDIFLTFNAETVDLKGGKQSKIITKMTRGRFSHVLICTSPPTLVEAVGAGVSTLSLARCYVFNIDNIKVLRYNNTEIAAEAATLAQREVGRDYSVRKAIASVFRGNSAQAAIDHGIFCSALVAQVFTEAGSPEFGATPAEKTTPATIDGMTGLTDITSRIFREGLAPSNIEQMSALDGDRSPTPSSRQTEITNRYAAQLVPLATVIARDFPEAKLVRPNTFFDIIQFLMDAYDIIPNISSGKQSSFKERIDELDAESGKLISSGELTQLLEDIIELDGQNIIRNIEESFKQNPDIDLRAMKSYLHTLIDQLQKRREALQPFIDWGAGRSKAVEGYITYQTPTISATERNILSLREIIERIQ